MLIQKCLYLFSCLVLQNDAAFERSGGQLGPFSQTIITYLQKQKYIGPKASFSSAYCLLSRMFSNLVACPACPAGPDCPMHFQLPLLFCTIYGQIFAGTILFKCMQPIYSKSSLHPATVAYRASSLCPPQHCTAARGSV